MAAKRRSPDDESDVGEIPATSKRARRDTDSEPAPKNTKRSNGKVKRVDSDDEDYDMGEGTVDAEEESRFEEEHGERIRQQVESKAKSTGSVAECGIIEYVEMHQFMCHKWLDFDFGPRINFIIGHNGSGKSAVLTAITIALGGKASTTGRGAGLKAFIREGQAASEVTIHLKNQGEDAFKPREYGKKIKITRRFTREGASTWKIQSEDNKTISNKREELQAICDHMNIQVDNPMNILTQDSARQFLSASSPADKYKLFLRGTQLQQLSEEYETCRQNITTTHKMLEKKKEALPDLREAFQSAQAKWRDAQAARDARNKVDTLKREIAWAHVRDKHDELVIKVEAQSKAQRRIPQVEEKLAEAQAKHAKVEEAVVAAEEAVNAFGTAEDLEARKRDVSDEIKDKSMELRKLEAEGKKMNEEHRRLTTAIKEYQESIDTETRKLADREAGRQEELRARLDDAEQKFKESEQETVALHGKAEEQENIVRESQRNGEAVQREIAQLQQEVQSCYTTIDQARRMAQNEFAVYGNGMQPALAVISKTRWHGETPVGPFGRFVKVRDHKWVDIVRAVLGARMFAFVVTDARDRQILKQIFDKHQLKGASIVVSSRDNFDFRSGEPAEHLTTFLRILEISDPFVLRTLVNTMNIERTMLFNTRAEAADVLGSIRGGGFGYTLDGFSVRNFGDGGEQSTPYNMRGAGEYRGLFQQGNAQQQQAGMQEELQRHEASLKNKNFEASQFQNQLAEARRLVSQYQRDAKTAKQRTARLKSQRDAVQQEVADEAPIEIAKYVDAKQEVEKELRDIEEQFANLETQKRDFSAQQTPLLELQAELRTKLAEYHSGYKALVSRAADLGAERSQAKSAADGWAKKLQDEKDKLRTAEEETKLCETEYEEWGKKAAEYCARVEGPRQTKELQRMLDAASKALKEREKRQGASVEDLQIEVTKAREACEQAEKELRQMAQLNKALRTAIHARFEKWHEFRRHIALRTKYIFQLNLSNRGYYGKVLFNHEQGTLSLKVQTDDQAGTQAKEKDPRSLSGGEKSFSTICLLLALWEAIGCPIRCLDEFDVYMDAVNRRISMKMMIDTARASAKKQYVLITPQDMSNVNIDPQLIKVNRMKDPERGQTQLNL